MSDLADFSLADAWETIADVVGDAPALYHQDIVRTWAEFEERSARLASVLLAHGVGHDSKVAHYLYNGPEYLEATFASFKARAVPVNVNYRYTDAELSYLLDNSDAEGIVVDTTFADHVERLLPSLPKVKLVVEVGGSVGTEDRGGVAWVGYEEAIAAAEPAPRIARSGDDLWFLYTGGTTGMPKGVMWPHRSLFGTGAATFKNFKLPLPATLDELADSVRTIHAEHETIRLLPRRQMHGVRDCELGVMCAGGRSTRWLPGASIPPSCSRRSNAPGQPDDRRRRLRQAIIAELERAESAGSPYELSSLRLVIARASWSPDEGALLARADVSAPTCWAAPKEWASPTPSPSAPSRRSGSVSMPRCSPRRAWRSSRAPGAWPTPSAVRSRSATQGPSPPARSAVRRPGVVGARRLGDRRRRQHDHLARTGSVCINTAGEKVFPERSRRR